MLPMQSKGASWVLGLQNLPIRGLASPQGKPSVEGVGFLKCFPLLGPFAQAMMHIVIELVGGSLDKCSGSLDPSAVLPPPCALTVPLLSAVDLQSGSDTLPYVPGGSPGCSEG